MVTISIVGRYERYEGWLDKASLEVYRIIEQMGEIKDIELETITFQRNIFPVKLKRTCNCYTRRAVEELRTNSLVKVIQ